MNPKLKDTLERIVALEDNFILDMKDFKSTPHECDTSYCIAGRLAYLDGYPEKYKKSDNRFYYCNYSGDLLCSEMFSDLWYFIFSSGWEDSLSHAKSRAQYVLDNDGEIPKGWCGDFVENYTWEPE